MYDRVLLKNIPKYQPYRRYKHQSLTDYKQTPPKNLTKRGGPHHIGQFPVPLPSSLYDGSRPNNVNSSNIAGSILNDMGHNTKTNNNKKQEDAQEPARTEDTNTTNQQSQKSQKSEHTETAANKTQKINDLLIQTFLWVVQFSVISIFIKDINVPSSLAYFGMLVIIGILTMDHGPVFKFGVLMILLLLNMLALKNS